ncbi:TPA: restriction endonuclease subunit S [Escherichia coli]|uniref:restriction endonuclease subunit S n=1 Tax=Enterobacteriaceae TaxID=543 RepID=UPI0010CC1663|nr:restriction endonuclease subunit S [Escherichia coli]EEZ5262860.1 restriction endonuclease subunit S [Escherichia coli]EKK1016240.1 restriction endonuclease subunit S [Escherichia coli]MBA8566378.1 restriction endonuclease subunit S [Escherichia coli]MED8244596.1 restriction endonuclease subunit S [Escherichia coli]MED9424040.1 restriction endonuclease subunit S [Escherichia coli]
MSEMSYLEKLLDGVEVEWKTLEDISIKISSGGTPKTGVSEFYDGDIPWLRTQEVNFCDIWDTEVKITESGVKNSSAKWIPKNCVIVAMYGATVGKIGINKIPMTTNQACANIQLNEEVAHYRYVFHFLCSQYTYIKSLGTGSQTNINAQIVKNIKIPIPCPDNPEKSLAIQSEIVRILDKFTALTAELTAELNMRKKQYNYYRDQLLSFDEGEVEWKALEEVSTFANGKGHEKDISEDGKYIVVNSKFISTNGEVAKLSNKQLCPLFKDDILLVMSDLPNGKALSKTFIVDEDHKYTLNQRIGGITVKNSNELLPKFLHYFLNRTPQLLKHDNGVDQTNLRKGQILEVKIPIISLIKQVQIVETLDKFDTYTKSISEGLPREIELRHKQYEYYRDLLFSFPRPETASN